MIKEILQAEIIILKTRYESIQRYPLNRDFQIESNVISNQIDLLNMELNKIVQTEWEAAAILNNQDRG